MLSICSSPLSQVCLDRFLARGVRLSSLQLGKQAAWKPIRTFTSHRQLLEQQAASPTQQTPQARVSDIQKTWSSPYPRIGRSPLSFTCAEFRSKYDVIQPDETVEEDTVVLHGRIRSQRTAGKKLVFFDLVHNGHKVQVLCNQRVVGEAGISPEKFKEFYHLLRRGDSFSVTGKPHRTSRGELTVKTTELPKLISPCLHDVPVHQKELEISPYERHVEFLSSPSAANILRARSLITHSMRNFFASREFMEVNTPILASKSGGAIAQPFVTSATEFPDRPLSLRIAPELWLKRLVVGGFDRVFEIGPSFRNEGLDKTHNPEFTTCEFYQAFADLESLIETTESLLSTLAIDVQQLNKKLNNSLSPTTVSFTGPYRRVDFIPAIEAAIGRKLPDLQSGNALSQVKEIFAALSLPLPAHETLPRLLDKLCSIYVESQLVEPTFIMNHPECMSPLSKSYRHPGNGQIVSARAELFVEGKEIMNMYEEENSPFEQRRKFHQQLSFRDPENAGELDEGYLQTLEWGLPPTGGWGCGIDRLCMLFTGARRISDVLSFGNLRSVTATSEPGPPSRQ
ncbi:lysine-tRNA ligase [Trichophyton rubrum D6]|uniref:Lysyl-tRNA synthetase n=2 Tax=Trichophyton rubrum TaxID=5551 RepID=F2STI3_TRIRC|nr:lysine-tRNA ligase [Trichophyton rubrum CBS 118892]EZF24298.1 lysine-tRNA ligase [Trichophyton rubrum MR850]EZF43259.1 lysine-tRNA ligase [Trichophyton rubrum CBS 100081]EZF53986.1 lysine-tRNA ligase [Trichophyton rubrum CBS 288.86]EZF64631.1 lysine-tRNA ligase [Trichophyton rubrum CBS 289.86]EZF85828.1 lysine-tRNA ligase [Trichophyton rubrum MR1448]EZF96697.1 lysine-tRNA ligase [Trichophyton rubrum MR1459]EZG07738.1 lysine-tRNA ligase [Trichophyton rubrum CBS 735.88]EZG18220.1 lysine-tR